MSLNISPTQLVTYDVSGTTLEAASNNLGLPGGEDGRCEYNIWYEYDGVSARGLAQNLVVNVTIDITMPRWLDRDAATEAEQREWDRFYAALLAHEREHASRIRAGARRVHDRLARTRATDLEARFQAGKQTMQEESNAFDVAVDHGRRPPPGTIITIP